MFDSYFTMKKVGEGTGLGLTVVYGIVQECGGGIDLESDVGEGTTFMVYFPAAGSQETEPVRGPSSPPFLLAGSISSLWMTNRP